MLEKEKKLWQKGFRFVAGLDEAGRGAIAGPITAAAVILDKKKIKDRKFKKYLYQIKDSKKISPRLREKIFSFIKKISLTYSIASLSSKIIDKKGISWANLEVMKRAIKKLKIKPDYFIVDGKLNFKNIKIPFSSIVNADEKIISCSAASILAKVSRDNLMKKLDKKYPEYGFAKHKGYGTKEHYQKLNRYGACPCHRKSFRLK